MGKWARNQAISELTAGSLALVPAPSAQPSFFLFKLGQLRQLVVSLLTATVKAWLAISLLTSSGQAVKLLAEPIGASTPQELLSLDALYAQRLRKRSPSSARPLNAEDITATSFGRKRPAYLPRAAL